MRIQNSHIHPSLLIPGDLEPNWVYFVALRSQEGFRWAEEYSRPENVELTVGTTECLQLLRRRKLDQGRELLTKLEAALKPAGKRSPTVIHVLGRWYYGALAYYHYVSDDFEEAERVLGLAHQEVVKAVDENRFLLPFASHCLDFCIQQIRVFRNQRRWPEMWKHIERAREVAAGSRPYCSLSDGTTVDVVAIQSFYRTVPNLTKEESASLRSVLDDNQRLGFFRHTISEIFSMSGFVIPYTPSRVLARP